MKQGTKAFTLVEIMIVVAIIGLLAALAIPNFLRSRSTAQAKTCINNLRVIDGAKQQWALETKQAATVTPTGANIQPYMGSSNTALPVCPLDSAGTFATSYLVGDCQTATQCQISPATHTSLP